MRFTPARGGGALLIGVLTCGLVQAHDFWVQPAEFQAAPGSWQTAGLFIGHPGEAERYSRNPNHLVSFEAHGVDPEGDARTWSLTGLPGATPAGRWRPPHAGAFSLAYRSSESTLTMEAEKFEAYLFEEGLESIVEERMRRGESRAPGRESYSRCAKSLLGVGDVEALVDRVVGLPLELILESDPAALVDSPEPDHFADLVVRLEFRGESLAGSQIQAWSLADPARVVYADTDAEGRVRLALPIDGPWMLSTVHMERAPADREGVDWVSLWSSHCFRVGSPPTASEG